MNKIKTYIYLSIIGISLWGTGASAQSKPAAERADAQTANMECELKLTPNQVQKIRAINLEASIGMDSAREVRESDMSLYYKKGRALNKQRNVELRGALTPRQFSLYERISTGDPHALRQTVNCRRGIEVVTENFGCCGL